MGSYYTKFAVRIGIVCDAILYESFAPAADFVYLPCDDWQDRLDGLDLLLLVSTWRGLNHGDWFGVGRVGDTKRRQLLELIAEAKRRGIKTAFYSKEDPPNYGVFLDFARTCDYVFTSAVEKIWDYRRDCGHNRVGLLRFCINPVHDNPIGSRKGEKIQGAIFSGSWIVKYPLRCRDLAAILDGVLKSRQSLCIVNRNSYREKHPWYRFARRFRKFELPAMPHAELAALHRKYEWSVNVNSVTDSETMFAARCYELLANGCLVISNFSVGMLKELPEIAIADTPRFACEMLTKLTDRDKSALRKAGIRRVMNGNTCFDRVAELLNFVGIKVDLPQPKVAVVIPDDDPDLRKMFDAQSYRNVELMAGGQGKVDLDGFDYVTYWQAGMKYGRYFIQDLLDAFKYADIDFSISDEPGYRYVRKPVSGRTLFRVGAAPIHGLSVGDETVTEPCDNLLTSIHEIVKHPERRPEDFRAPFLVRALSCLYDNGILYTLKRIVYGKQHA